MPSEYEAESAHTSQDFPRTSDDEETHEEYLLEIDNEPCSISTEEENDGDVPDPDVIDMAGQSGALAVRMLGKSNMRLLLKSA